MSEQFQAVGTYTEPLAHGRGEVQDIAQFTGGTLNGFGAHSALVKKHRSRALIEASRLYADIHAGREEPMLLRQAMNPTKEVYVRYLSENYPGIFGDVAPRNGFGLRETMATTDYQALYVDVLDRMYYGYYNAYPVVNKALCKIHSLRDFRTVKRYMLDGMVSPMKIIDPAAPPSRADRALYGPVPQDGATYGPATSTAAVTYYPSAYQAETAVNWRAFIDDNLSIFQDIAARLGIAGGRAIHQYITQQFFDANGPHASLFSSGYGNIINTTNGASSTNPAFSAQGIADGLKVLAGMKDSAGYPIMVTGKTYLVYPPAYVAAAQNLKRALTIQLSVEGGTQSTAGFPSTFVNVENWIMQDLVLVMDPFIPLVATNNKNSWIMVVDPNVVNRPAVELGFLSGFETPQLYRKLPNTLRVDGGVETLMGDYYSMDSETKIVGVWGAGRMDGRSCVGSNSSGA